MINLDLIFQFVKGRCQVNQIILQKMLSTATDTTCIRCTNASKLENKLQYYSLTGRINSANDASISCENFVKFGPLIPSWRSSFVNVR